MVIITVLVIDNNFRQFGHSKSHPLHKLWSMFRANGLRSSNLFFLGEKSGEPDSATFLYTVNCSVLHVSVA
jgi:hypothetical protein